MRTLGKYNGLVVYAVERQEYIDKELYDNFYTYYVIEDDKVLTDDGRNWYSLVLANELVGLVKPDFSLIDTKIAKRVYYSMKSEEKKVKIKEPKARAEEKKVRENAASPSNGTEEPVDLFLRSPQSVDEYLKEMKEIVYYEMARV